jgi:exopolysaccharide production protein ExoY
MSGKLQLSTDISLIYITDIRPGSLTDRARLQAADATKRLVDLVGATIGLVVLAVPMLLVLGLVALDGGQPLYAHRRVGRGGQGFRCWKVRTMQRDAEAKLALLLQDPANAEEWNRNVKLAEDPRVTRIGRVLRRCRIDELPQLWNVLLGEMSLVGPRPVTREELPRFGAATRLYCSARPGMTGPWQIFGHGTSYDERVEMDRNYLENRSIVGDFRLLLMTPSVLVRRTGC